MRCTDIGRRQKYRAAAIYVIFVALMIGTIRQKGAGQPMSWWATQM